MVISENKISRSQDYSFSFETSHAGVLVLLERTATDPSVSVEISGSVAAGYQVTLTKRYSATLYVNYVYAEEI